MPGLRNKVLVPGAGHLSQQERPKEVNDLLIEFLASLQRPAKSVLSLPDNQVLPGSLYDYLAAATSCTAYLRRLTTAAFLAAASGAKRASS